MAQTAVDWESVRPNMLRMIRSARSRAQQRSVSGDRTSLVAPSSDSTSGGYVCSESSHPPVARICAEQVISDCGSTSAGTEHSAPSDSRSLKRVGATRLLGFGANRSSSRGGRPTRTRSLHDAHCENAAPYGSTTKRPQQQLQAPIHQIPMVLGDVTNLTNHQLPPPQPVDAQKSHVQHMSNLRLISRTPVDVGSTSAAAAGASTAAAAALAAVGYVPAPDFRAPRPSMTDTSPSLPPPSIAAVPPYAPQPALTNATQPAPMLMSGGLLPAPTLAEVKMDLGTAEDPQEAFEYANDIYRSLQHDEAVNLPDPAYMDRQPHVNGKMRSILVDWLVDVHRKYKMQAETLFLAISILDRYLEKRVTARKHLQLVGATALLVAAKFEETYPPTIKDFVFVTDKAYTEEEVIKMEVSILTALDFKICHPTACPFMDRYVRVNGCNDAHRDLAQYLLELTLIDYRMVKWCPSHVAAASVLLSNKLLRKQPSWSSAAVKHTNMTEQTLKECAREVLLLLECAEQSHLQAVRKKFSQPRYHQVAQLPFTTTQSRPSRCSNAGDSGDARQRPRSAVSIRSSQQASVILPGSVDASSERTSAPRHSFAMVQAQQPTGDAAVMPGTSATASEVAVAAWSDKVAEAVELRRAEEGDNQFSFAQA